MRKGRKGTAVKKTLMRTVLLTLVLSILASCAFAESGWYCPACGRHNKASYKYCPYDGTKKPSSKKAQPRSSAICR